MKVEKEKALEWLEKGLHDISTVELIIMSKGYADVAGVLLQQSLEKYMKGFLIFKGWKLKKTHDLKELLDEAVKYDDIFKDYYDLFDVLTHYFFEERYPLGLSETTIDEIKELYDKVKVLIEFIDKKVRN